MKPIDSSIQFSSKSKKLLSFDFLKQISRVCVHFGMKECCASRINVECGNVKMKKYLMSGKIKILLSLCKFALKMWTKVFQTKKLAFLKAKIVMILTGCIMKSMMKDQSMSTWMKILKLLPCIMVRKFGRQFMKRIVLIEVKKHDVRKSRCSINLWAVFKQTSICISVISIHIKEVIANSSI